MAWKRAGRRGAGLWVALCATPALFAQAQPTFYEAFTDGEQAMHQGQWRQAIRALERAVQLRPAPASRVIIYGNNLLTNYYPYSLLARCHLELGDSVAAAAFLRQAEDQGEPASFRQPIARRLPHPVEPHPAQALEPRQDGIAPTSGAAPPASQSSQEVLARLPQPPAPETVHPPPLADPLPAPAQPGAKHLIAPPPAPEAQAAPPHADAPALPPGAAPRQAASLPQPAGQAEGSPPPETLPRSPEPYRPIPMGFWVLAGGSLAALAASLGWKRWHRKTPMPPALPVPPEASPVTVGPYRVLRTLGHGGFATTYLARHQTTGQEVALKVLHPHRLQDPDFRRRFGQEARLGALLDHPNLVRLLDPGEDESTSWIALEYVPGPTLEAYLKEHGPLPVAEAVAIALGIAEAIAYAHTRSVVHRDLKPSNVILSKQGPKVMDLGIARDLDSAALTTTFAFLGTPLYAAPEAQLVAKVGPAADRYSLGVILFEMLAGRQPFQGETPFAIMAQHRSAPVPDIQAWRPVPPALARLLERLLDKEPDQRPEDGELVVRLKAFCESEERKSSQPAPVRQTRG
ncbi:MAG: protein kinase [Holophaga sp.]|nr:protein kinase [Holophaga sp.]